MRILQINSSVRPFVNGAGSHSTRLADELVRTLVAAHPEAELTVRDLGRNPHPILDPAALAALQTAPDRRSAEQAARVALDDALIAELQAADVLVLGVPMYNFGVPVQFKAWLDAVARAGVTFRYTDQGPVGLVTGKTVHVVTTRGGLHQGRPTDTVEPFLRTVLGFLGMTDVRFVFAEGLGMGPEAEARGLAAAREQIAREAGAPALVG